MENPIYYLVNEFNSTGQAFSYTILSDNCYNHVLEGIQKYVEKYGEQCGCAQAFTCTCPEEFKASLCHYDNCPFTKFKLHPEFVVGQQEQVYKVVCLNVKRPTDTTLNFLF